MAESAAAGKMVNASAPTQLAKLIGSVSVEPATVQPGQSVLVEVLDAGGKPYAASSPVVAGALREFLMSRGRHTAGVEMRALVPVSVRTEGEHHEGGNRIVAMRGPLPIYISDPLNRLRFVSNAMEGLKESKQALGAEVIAGAQNFAPPTILAQASRLNFSTRLFNLIVTNVPGPQFPLYVLGREMLQAIPVAFLPENHALAIAIMSYNGHINFGLLADYDAMPDVELVGNEITEGLAQLVDLALQHGRMSAAAQQNGSEHAGSPTPLN